MGMLGVFQQHGYAVVALVLFLAAAGVPVPTSVVMLGAGAASVSGHMNLGILFVVCWIAGLAGDSLLYLGGRYTGWWLLAGLCRLTMNPEGCIFSSSAYFYRRGARTLLFSRWIPGLSAMAAPLAGSLNMRFPRFLRLDAGGVAIYVLVWLGVGRLFSGYIVFIVDWLQTLGHAVLIVVLAMVALYLISVLIFSLRARKYDKIQKITASDLRSRIEALDQNTLVVIADVRSHNYYDPGMTRIKNSIRVEPTRLKEELIALREFMAPECEIFLYCSCIRDTTSKRVAYMLEQENCAAQVIDGGLKAWIKAGGETELVPESDIQHLPRFE